MISYSCDQNRDEISVSGIKQFLAYPEASENIILFEEIDSTSREAKKLAISGCAHGTVILANRQSAGKGRRGRSFFSPPYSGIYMSVILDNAVFQFSSPTAVTAYTALCVCDAIESVCDLIPSIKWVNDIILDGKKIGGILTEAVTALKTHTVSAFIIGIGINVSTKTSDFPVILQKHAGSIYPDGNAPVSRNQLVAEIINRLFYGDKPDEGLLFEQYKERLFMLGTDILVIQENNMYMARALDINDQGHLIIKKRNGETVLLLSGEISILSGE